MIMIQEKKSNVYFISISAVIIFYILHIIPLFSDSSYFWGSDMWRYLPLWIIIIMTCISVMSIIPLYSKKVFQYIDYIFSLERKVLKRIPKWGRYVLLFTVSFIILWTLRIRTYFLGDSQLRLTNLANGEKYSVFEPLDMFIHSKLYSFFSRFMDVDPAFVYNIISIICGIIFIYIVIKFSKVYSSSKEFRFFIISVFFFMGTIQLFFGYIENYTIFALLVFVVLYYGYKYLNYQFPLYKITFLSSFAFTIHPMGILLVPS